MHMTPMRARGSVNASVAKDKAKNLKKGSWWKELLNGIGHKAKKSGRN